MWSALFTTNTTSHRRYVNSLSTTGWDHIHWFLPRLTVSTIALILMTRFAGLTFSSLCLSPSHRTSWNWLRKNQARVLPLESKGFLSSKLRVRTLEHHQLSKLCPHQGLLTSTSTNMKKVSTSNKKLNFTAIYCESNNTPVKIQSMFPTTKTVFSTRYLEPWPFTLKAPNRKWIWSTSSTSNVTTLSCSAWPTLQTSLKS